VNYKPNSGEHLRLPVALQPENTKYFYTNFLISNHSHKLHYWILTHI